jgi:hypothetical protein
MNLSSISKALNIGAALVALIPGVITPAIQAVEGAIGPGNGKAKLDAVLGIVQSAYSAVTNVEVTWNDIAPAVTSSVSALVTAFNAVKAFAHGGQPPAGTPAGK